MYEKTFIDFHNFVMFRNVVSTRQKEHAEKNKLHNGTIYMYDNKK